MMLLEPPRDAQLEFIKRLVAERGWQHPDAVASKQEASQIIGEMLSASYQASKCAMPFTRDAVASTEEVPEEVPF